ncbi:WYL domain-containing protein [Streptomyces sp. WAC05374]|uniref:helix-turn-helix transcriptional regulator n=1 Tax=Streptomyces sp. WAC05374 TaxID=2487420 RepID=UPI000F891A52|nr:WYL domain-containing protein [Streptomyces sp. WAC05374]RST15895.1 WYL domain-containing protein [Streptomyces sp. WAC05374]TDF54521.1 WYL domain-containing protein [Streptomyces sp. WAC05374]TDF56156.1 WYL domain-containing protein [Streptomyces sp. WAC05374]
MRADRLLSLLLLLQNRGRMTAPELAAELEVSVRTVYRDIEALGAAGVPVRADRGPEGGYRLVDGYRTRLTGLTDAEATSLFLTGAPGPARDLGLGAVLATARLKLEAALPAELAEQARRVRDRFHLDAPAWFRDADPVPYLEPIARAVWEQRVLRAHYRRWGGEVRRELRPLGIVLKGGIWYLVAMAEAEAVRTYRIARFLAVEATGEVFERPGGFGLAAYWEESARRLEAALHRGTALLRISPRAQRLLPMRFGAVGVRALDGAGAPDAEGWVRVELPVETEAVAVGDLLALGTDAEVLGPPELRRAVAEAVAVLAGRYAP